MNKQTLKLKEAIEACGGAQVVAKQFGFKTSWSVYKWVNEQIPADRVWPFVQMVRKSGKQIKCHDLRPDCFPSNV